MIGDHGWNLGEHGTWCKHSIMNTCLHSTLIIDSPEIKTPYRCEQIVEFVDLYPTMCDAAGIERPAQLEGTSLLPLLKSPKAKTKGVWGFPLGKTVSLLYRVSIFIQNGGTKTNGS